MHLYDCAFVEVVHHAGGGTILETILVEIIQINRQNYRNSRSQKTRPSIYTKEPSKLQDQSKLKEEKIKTKCVFVEFIRHACDDNGINTVRFLRSFVEKQPSKIEDQSESKYEVKKKA
jgi:hypothetical protein